MKTSKGGAAVIMKLLITLWAIGIILYIDMANVVSKIDMDLPDT
jgi:hypothetical protein